MVGLIELDSLDPRHDSAELGFLLNERHWGHGYATEAAVVVVWFGFHVLRLNRIYARHLASNAASKLGQTGGRRFSLVALRASGLTPISPHGFRSGAG